MFRHQPSFVVNKSTALARKTHHQFCPGIGYVAHSGPPELQPGSNGSANCIPAATAADGTLHLMQPPQGHPPITMRWVAVERAWESLQPERGNRLAWPADYLRKVGWAYLRPAISAADQSRLPGAVIRGGPAVIGQPSAGPRQ